MEALDEAPRRSEETGRCRLPLGNGKRQEEPTQAKTRKEAKKIRDGRFEQDAAKTRVADLIDDLKRDYRVNGRNEKEVAQRWNHLSPMFDNDLALAVTMTRLNRYVEARLAEQAKPATVQRELAFLRRALRPGF